MFSKKKPQSTQKRACPPTSSIVHLPLSCPVNQRLKISRPSLSELSMIGDFVFCPFFYPVFCFYTLLWFSNTVVLHCRWNVVSGFLFIPCYFSFYTLLIFSTSSLSYSFLRPVHCWNMATEFPDLGS